MLCGLRPLILGSRKASDVRALPTHSLTTQMFAGAHAARHHQRFASTCHAFSTSCMPHEAAQCLPISCSGRQSLYPGALVSTDRLVLAGRCTRLPPMPGQPCEHMHQHTKVSTGAADAAHVMTQSSQAGWAHAWALA